MLPDKLEQSAALSPAKTLLFQADALPDRVKRLEQVQALDYDWEIGGGGV